jgi:hypothetical protein
LALAGKIRYEIDPANQYPANFTGHLLARFADGRVEEIEKPHMRGGAREPLSLEELETKFVDNARYGGWTGEQAGEALKWSGGLFEEKTLVMP